MKLEKYPFIECFVEGLKQFKLNYFSTRKDKFGHLGKKSFVMSPSTISNKGNIYLYDRVNIDGDNILYITDGKFIMKKESGAARGLTVVAGNHVAEVGESIKDRGNANCIYKDIIVDEEVWIAAHVTILAGTHIGRGAIIGAGSVLRGNKIPPYAIIAGNPAKVIGFRYTVEEIIEHEKIRYKPEERIPVELIEKNYKKYFLDRIDKIKEFNRLY